jgi:competence protein ComEC
MTDSALEPLALARGLLLGDDAGFSIAMRRIFREAGVTHLTAASGANLALVAWLTGPWRGFWPRRWGQIWLAAAYGLYWRLSGGSGSLWRSIWFALVFLWSSWLGRRVSPWWALFWVGVGSWLVSPYSRTLGFWLSLAAMSGVLFSRSQWPGEKIVCLLPRWLRWGKRIIMLLNESVVIFAFVGPILWLSFGSLSLAGVIITPLVSPLVFPYQLTALLLFGSERLVKPLAPLLRQCLVWEYAFFLGFIRTSLAVWRRRSFAILSVLFFLVVFPAILRVSQAAVSFFGRRRVRQRWPLV